MSEKTQIITRKIEIYVVGPDKAKKDSGYATLRYLNDAVWRMANEVVNHQHFNLLFNERSYQNEDCAQLLAWYAQLDELNRANSLAKYQDADVKSRIKDIRAKMHAAFQTKPLMDLRGEFMQTSTENTTYRLLRKKYPNVPSSITASLNRQVTKKYSNELKELLMGRRTLPNFKKGLPIPFNIKAIRQLKKTDNRDYTFTWAKIDFKTKLGRDRSNNEVVLDRIMSGEYKLGDSHIQVTDNKVFLLTSVTIPAAENKLDENKICGVDLGMATPAYCALNSGFERCAVGSQDDIVGHRMAFKKRRHNLQRALKTTSGGRGRNKKLKKLNAIKSAERNWATTKNHVISKQVVNFALNNNCATINLEDLTNVKNNIKSEFVLRNWAYNQLQIMIEQKAAKEGIKVKYVDPKYTSQTCHVCGHTSATQRINQSDFACENSECANYNKKIHADYNAARNIAVL